MFSHTLSAASSTRGHVAEREERKERERERIKVENCGEGCRKDGGAKVQRFQVHTSSSYTFERRNVEEVESRPEAGEGVSEGQQPVRRIELMI